MATTDTAPVPVSHDINYLAKLHDTLRTSLKDFKAQAKASEAGLKNLKDVDSYDSNNLAEWKPFVSNGLKDYQTLQVINEDIIDINLSVQNTVSLANASSAGATDTAVKTAAAAKALDTANFSVAKLTSDVASIYAKLNSEDKYSEMTILCAAAYERTQEAAKMAERATVAVLHSSIEAAKSQAFSVASIIKTAAAASTDLAGSFAADTLAAQENAISSYQTYLDKVTTKSADDVNVVIAANENITLNLIGGTGDFAFLYEQVTPKPHPHKLPAGEKEKKIVEKEIAQSVAGEPVAK